VATMAQISGHQNQTHLSDVSPHVAPHTSFRLVSLSHSLLNRVVKRILLLHSLKDEDHSLGLSGIEVQGCKHARLQIPCNLGT